jgi:glycine/D-amino acid oxidase-like deaminating enzyme
MEQSERIVVVGHDVVGWSVVLRLLDHGLGPITLVAADPVPSGPSWRRWGGMLHYPADAELGDLFKTSVTAYQRLDMPLSEPRGVVLLGELERVANHALSLAPVRELTPTMLEARELGPLGVPERWTGCRLNNTGYLVSPHRLTGRLRSLASGHVAVRRGITRLWWESESEGICSGVEVNGRRLAARATVITAGAGAAPLLARAGKPVLALEPWWDMTAVLSGFEPPDTPLLEVADRPPARAAAAFSLIGVDNPAPGGPTCVLGSTFSLGSRPTPVMSWPELWKLGQRFVPALQHARPTSLLVCELEVSPDGRPYIGRVPGTDSLWIAGGGIAALDTGWAVGAALADAIRLESDRGIPPALRADREPTL